MVVARSGVREGTERRSGVSPVGGSRVMTKCRLAIVAAALLITGGGAVADIGGEALSEAVKVSYAPARPTGGVLRLPLAPSGSVERLITLAPDLPFHGDLADALAAVPFAEPSQEGPFPPQAVRRLPAEPGAASLFVFAVTWLGAVKLGSSVRKLHLAPLPEWYHPAGPARIGNAVALDLQFSLPAISALDAPAELHPAFCHFQRQSPWRCPDDFFLPIQAPRGPPLLTP